MGIENSLSWYQKKIGTYDKQPWEKTIEERILHGLNNIQLKNANAKPKTDLIDLDLVRGSSFTKAKPKHGFCTVLRLSVLRIVLLPCYSKWWVKQTSGKIFLALLGLYFLQLFNIGVYSYHSGKELNIPLSEFVVPILMIWILSFIHSQIVSTTPTPDSDTVPAKDYKTYRRLRRKSRKLKSDCSSRTRLCPCPYKRSPNNDKNVLFDDTAVIIPSSSSNRTPKTINRCLRNRSRKRSGIDDDGFESLNGNGSSPSDNGELDHHQHHHRQQQQFKSVKDKASQSESSGRRCNEWVQTLPLSRRQSAPDISFFYGGCETDSDTSMHEPPPNAQLHRVVLADKARLESTCDTDEEGECETISSPDTVTSGQIGPNASGSEWPMGLTSNSEDCSYSSEMSEEDGQYDLDAPPNSILSPYCGPSDRVSCTIWDHKEIKKADLSVIEISSVIIARVEAMPENTDCFYMGMFITTILAVLPILCRFCDQAIDTTADDELQLSFVQITHLVVGKFSNSFDDLVVAFLGNSHWERVIMLTAMLQRFALGFFLFFLLAVAERTFKQRFLYAKFFSHLTSSRRARKSDLPHFRLNKVRNIITWLSVRSYLKKRGPQRSVEVIVSAAFIANLLLLSILCMELLKDTFVLNSQYNLEILTWSLGVGIVILRFMILGVKINKKYRNLSVLITEQINLYLQIEQKPNKKEELMVANSVLKLAADLLKELESQFKILGLSVNPVLYNITKVVILSALSGVLSEILGFKLKLHKIKIK